MTRLEKLFLLKLAVSPLPVTGSNSKVMGKVKNFLSKVPTRKPTPSRGIQSFFKGPKL
jgi:hypothetical protein